MLCLNMVFKIDLGSGLEAFEIILVAGYLN
jgi:hypothetical protein